MNGPEDPVGRAASWHVHPDHLRHYAAGSAGQAVVASVEAHLLACERCRAAMADVAGPGDRDAAWERLAVSVDRPRSRLLSRASGSTGLLRASVATPAMVGAALTAAVVVGLVPLLVAFAAPGTGLVALLVLAPLAPSAAVALAYREWADPAGEIGLAVPTAGLRLVALRAAAVSAVSLPVAVGVLLLVDALVTDVPVSFGFAWGLPGLALAALVLLAGTTRLDPGYVALGLGSGWALTVVAVARLHRSMRPEQFVDLIWGPGVQLGALVVLTAAVSLTVLRRDAATTAPAWRTS